MSTINLIIGNTDVSEYVLAEGYKVRLVQKKSENSSFTKYDGTEVTRILGYYYEISASLTLVPDDTAKALAAAMSEEKFNVDFTDPWGVGNAEFLRSDSASFEVTAEVDEGLLWDIEISMRSELINSGGGLSWDLGLGGDIGNIRFSWSVSGLGLSGRCPSQLEFDIYDPPDSVIDNLASPNFAVTPKCPELEIEGQPFWVDSRSVSNDICHVVCYDRMSRTDAPFSTNYDWKTQTMTANQVLDDICRICGFGGHSMSGGVGGGLQYINFTQAGLTGKTCGELLDMISEAMVGIWVCSGNSLTLVCLGGFEGAQVNSSEHTEIEYQGRTQIIGVVMKNSSTGKTFSYGSTSGNGVVIQVESGFVSADLADIVKNRVLNYEYIAWNCEKAIITAEHFSFGGLLQFAYSGGGSDNLESPLFPRTVNCSVDSTGIYFSGGCAPVDEWNYKSKLEREKIGIGKAVGNTTIAENGDIVFVNKNNEGGGLDDRDNGIGICVRNKNI